MNDIKGKNFGRLTVLELHHKVQTFAKNGTKSGNRYYYLCECVCGNKTVVRGSHLTSGKTLSCGCLLQERRIEANIKHNLSNTRINKIWRKMKERCYNANSIRYNRYGARGIKVCNEWKNDFLAFYNWAILNGYQENFSIDRIDNKKDYCPENCRWIPLEKQARNTSQNHFITYQNKTMCISEWAELYNINYYVLYSRLFNLNWNIEKALTMPIKVIGNPQ